MDRVMEQLEREGNRLFAKLVYTLNLLDLFFTLHAIAHGAMELNPLMRSVPVMVAWKVLGVGALCWLLNHFAKGGNMAARWGLRICAAAFAAVDVYHVIIMQ